MRALEIFARSSRIALLALALGGTAAQATATEAVAQTTGATAAVVEAAIEQDACTRESVPATRPRYGWPLKPFYRQHPVRGYFGDPRIGKGPNGTISRSFHFGVDVSAPDGTAVYATATGVARVNQGHENTVSIRPGDGSAFAYWHIVPAIEHGQRVVAYRTVIGYIAKGWEHVHFAEWRGGGYVNPLRPGAMGPYADHTCPTPTGMSFELRGEEIAAEALGGSFDIVVEAADLPAMSAPAPWFQLPVTPALIRWRILDNRGKAVNAWRAAYDVREQLPEGDYHAVYAAGTTQNHPDRPGLYRFHLARGVRSVSLGAGNFRVQVHLVDSRGNAARATWPFTIA